jgi:hypothetical protein
VEPDHWTVTIQFDDLATQEQVSPELTFPYDELSSLIAHVSQKWDLLPEELADLAEWTPTRITFQLEILDFVQTVMDWVCSHCVPKSVTITRNRERL